MDPIELLTRLPVPWLARCRVPSHIGELRSAGEEVPARACGLAQSDIERTWEAVEALYRTGVHPALQLCLRYRGHVLLDRAIGHAAGNAPEDPRGGPRRVVGLDTPFCLFSASKAITAMVIHKLDEQRVLHLEDRVCDFIPEFGRYGKHRITLRHLLCHRAGIPNLPPGALDAELITKPEHLMEILYAQRPRTRPGRLLAYHAVTGGFVLAEVVRRVTGQDIRTVLRKEIAEPLGMRWLGYGVEPEDIDCVAHNAVTGPPAPPPVSTVLRNALGTDLKHAVDISNDPRFLTGIVPGANVMCTANELSAFFQCLMNGGELDGVRIFEPTTVRRATAEQSYLEFDLTLGVPLRYGLGFMLGGPVSAFGWDTSEAFGHVGLSNILGWADPKRHLAIGFVNSGKPLLTLHMVRLMQLLLAIPRLFPKEG